MIEDMMETNCLLIEQFLDQVLPHFRVDIRCLADPQLALKRPFQSKIC